MVSKSKKLRKQRGAMLGFVAAGTMALVLVFFALMQLLLNVGGSREVRNAVDAGTLSVGNDVVSLKTTAQDSAEQQFNDVADKDNSFGLTNINRVWAKALLVRMNAAAMQNEGTAGNSGTNADTLFDAAERISDRIADKVSDQNNTQPFFNSLSQSNSARMLGASATVQSLAGNNWKTALMDRGEESNIIAYEGQLPSGFDLASNKTKTADDGLVHFQGYTPISVLNRNICFVPFKVKQEPHLVSGNTFNDNTHQTNPLTSWTKPVPNAFSCEGKTQKQTAAAHQATAFVLSNPQTNFDLAIPHAFVRIKFEDNTAKWYANGIYHGSNSYSFHTDVQVRQYEAGVGTMTVTATLGNEYMPPTLDQAIHAIPGHNYSDVDAALLQRIKEIKHDFTSGDLTALLSSQIFIPGTQEYVLFPDNNGKIKAAPKDLAVAMAPWINAGSAADGSEKDMSSEDTWWVPNFVVVILEGPGPKPLPSFTHETGDIRWQPGSGYDGCLGQLRIERTTEIYANGACTIL